jgi:fructose-bisphosphate aldolase class 1
VLRVLALSGGYRRDEACTLLARDPTMIASFSRALLEGLSDPADRRPVQRAARRVDRADLRRLGEQVARRLSPAGWPAMPA